MFCKEHNDINLNSRTSMINFLKNHFRYDTMNSWNNSTSYANNVKLHNLSVPAEYQDLAYDIISGEIQTPDYDIEVHEIMNEFLHETGYSMGFNGRSGGYIVMYETRLDKSGKSYSVYPGRSIDQYEDFEDWEDSDIKDRVELVMKFDKACERIYHAFLNTLKYSELEEKTVYIEKTVKTLIPKE